MTNSVKVINPSEDFHDKVEAPDASVVLRMPRPADGPAIHDLIADCPPLDLNSVYTYLLLSEHFSQTCVAAVTPDGLQGFVSAYVPPARPVVVFVWQMAVHHGARGQGLAALMLKELLSRPGLSAIQYIETTVGPGNIASRGVFASLARNLKAPMRETPLFRQGLFGAQGHEDEPLLRIGPFVAR